MKLPEPAPKPVEPLPPVSDYPCVTCGYPGPHPAQLVVAGRGVLVECGDEDCLAGFIARVEAR